MSVADVKDSFVPDDQDSFIPDEPKPQTESGKSLLKKSEIQQGFEGIKAAINLQKKKDIGFSVPKESLGQVFGQTQEEKPQTDLENEAIQAAISESKNWKEGALGPAVSQFAGSVPEFRPVLSKEDQKANRQLLESFRSKIAPLYKDSRDKVRKQIEVSDLPEGYRNRLIDVLNTTEDRTAVNAQKRGFLGAALEEPRDVASKDILAMAAYEIDKFTGLNKLREAFTEPVSSDIDRMGWQDRLSARMSNIFNYQLDNETSQEIANSLAGVEEGAVEMLGGAATQSLFLAANMALAGMATGSGKALKITDVLRDSGKINRGVTILNKLLIRGIQGESANVMFRGGQSKDIGFAQGVAEGGGEALFGTIGRKIVDKIVESGVPKKFASTAWDFTGGVLGEASGEMAGDLAVGNIELGDLNSGTIGQYLIMAAGLAGGAKAADLAISNAVDAGVDKAVAEGKIPDALADDIKVAGKQAIREIPDIMAGTVKEQTQIKTESPISEYQRRGKYEKLTPIIDELTTLQQKYEDDIAMGKVVSEEKGIEIAEKIFKQISNEFKTEDAYDLGVALIGSDEATISTARMIDAYRSDSNEIAKALDERELPKKVEEFLLAELTRRAQVKGVFTEILEIPAGYVKFEGGKIGDKIGGFSSDRPLEDQVREIFQKRKEAHGQEKTGESQKAGQAETGAESQLGVDEEREVIKKNLPFRFKEIEKRHIGSATPTFEDLKSIREKVSAINKITGLPSIIQEEAFGKLSDRYADFIARNTQKIALKKNKTVRLAYGFFDSLLKNISKTQEQTQRGETMLGSQKKYIEDSLNIKKSIDKIVSGDRKSLTKIDMLLDPDFYIERGDDVGTAQLTHDEKQAYNLIREILDFVHDANYAYGFIDKATYDKNRGQYSARLYTPMELPKDIQDQIKSFSKYIDYGIYKKLEDLDDFKLENKVTDPSYMAAKRLMQTMQNIAIKEYSDFVASNPGLVSDGAKPGFTQLNGKSYGGLDGKYVINSVAEDFKGYLFQNHYTQKIYDVFKSYDRWAPRQFYKKLFTIYNPGVHLGNIMSDNVFGFLVGVDPFSLNYEIFREGGALSEIKNNGPLYRFALQNGLLDTDIARSDFVGLLKKEDEQILEAAKSRNPFKWLSEKAESIYRGADDVYKLAALKKLMDFGIEPEIALNRVKEGFQNSQRVGRMYDFTSKIPIIGKPFGKFSGDLLRITQAAARNRPLQLASFLGTLLAMGGIASIMSGEDPDDRKLREERTGFPKIPTPIGDIPLEWKVGNSTLNIARLITPMYMYSDLNSDDLMIALAKLFPFIPEYEYKTQNPGGIAAVNLAKNIEDPILGPWFQLALNSDFRGTAILDPQETKYRPSGLTPTEKAVNALVFLGRAFVPYGAYGDDMLAALQDREDYYGRSKTPEQVIARFLGIRLELYEDDRYNKILVSFFRRKAFEYLDYAKALRDLEKKRKEGSINSDTYIRRTANLIEKQATVLSEAKKFFNENEKRLTRVGFNKILEETELTDKQKQRFKRGE